MDMKQQLSEAFIFNNVEKLKELYIALLNKRSFLDKWFDKFIDTYDNKLTTSNRSSPVWKKYHQKFDEYETLVSDLKVAEYYLKRIKNV